MDLITVTIIITAHGDLHPTIIPPLGEATLIVIVHGVLPITITIIVIAHGVLPITIPAIILVVVHGAEEAITIHHGAPQIVTGEIKIIITLVPALGVVAITISTNGEEDNIIPIFSMYNIFIKIKVIKKKKKTFIFIQR